MFNSLSIFSLTSLISIYIVLQKHSPIVSLWYIWQISFHIFPALFSLSLIDECFKLLCSHLPASKSSSYLWGFFYFFLFFLTFSTERRAKLEVNLCKIPTLSQRLLIKGVLSFNQRWTDMFPEVYSAMFDCAFCMYVLIWYFLSFVTVMLDGLYSQKRNNFSPPLFQE